jgi:hypothetical protein
MRMELEDRLHLTAELYGEQSLSTDESTSNKDTKKKARHKDA